MWGNKTEFAIGIDVGTKTGFALYDRKRKILIEVKTMRLHKALERVKELHKQHNVRVYIEDPNKMKKPPKTAQDFAKGQAKAQGVGSVKRDAAIWKEMLEDEAIPFEMVPPNPALTKLKPEVFSRMTNYTGLASNHARDAAMIVYGR